MAPPPAASGAAAAGAAAAAAAAASATAAAASGVALLLLLLLIERERLRPASGSTRGASCTDGVTTLAMLASDAPRCRPVAAAGAAGAAGAAAAAAAAALAREARPEGGRPGAATGAGAAAAAPGCLPAGGCDEDRVRPMLPPGWRLRVRARRRERWQHAQHGAAAAAAVSGVRAGVGSLLHQESFWACTKDKGCAPLPTRNRLSLAAVVWQPHTTAQAGRRLPSWPRTTLGCKVRRVEGRLARRLSGRVG